MSRSYSIGLYRLSVKIARKQDSQLNLSEPLAETEENFYDYVEKCLGKYQTDVFGDEDSEHYLKVSSFESIIYKKTESKKYRKIEGLVQSGDSGFASEIYDTKKKTGRKKGKHEAELIPYYIGVSETADPSSCVLCLQRFGSSGVLTNFIKFLRSEMKNDYPKLVLEYHAFLPDFYIRKFITDSTVRRFKYKYLASIADQATLLTVEGGRISKDAEVIVTTTIESVRGLRLAVKDGVKDGVNKILSKISPTLHIDDNKMLDKSIEFVNSEGHARSFSIKRDDNEALPYIDVTQEVGRNEDGHPDYNQLRKAVEDILVESEVY